MKYVPQEHDIIVGCLTIEQMPEPHEQGSTTHWCVECSAMMWCGPSTIIGIVKRHPLATLQFMCIRCMTLAQQEGLGAESVEVLSEQLEAIAAQQAGRGPK